MSTRIKLMILIAVALMVSINIFTESLTNLRISGAEILVIRSCNQLIFISLYCIAKKKSIITKNARLQASSFIFSGLSLLMIMTGFQYISASSVSTLQRMDIPLLILIAAFTSKVTKTQIFLSFVTFAIIIGLILLSNETHENRVGYLIVFTGVLCVCINALLLKKISQKEEVQIIIFIISLSSFLWSLLRCYQQHTWFSNIKTAQYLIIAMLGAFDIIIIFIITQLYKLYKPDFVQYLFLLCTFLTTVVEMIVKHKLFSPILLFGNTLLLVVVTYLVRTRFYETGRRSLDMKEQMREIVT